VSATQTRHLRPGDLVEVRPAAEILATLDPDGMHAGIPFMPEMIPYLGRRLRVSKRVEKICWYTPESSSRRLPDTVLLEEIRCDGSAHGGCQAECRIYWKEAWLRPIDDITQGTVVASHTGDLERLRSMTEAATRVTTQRDQGSEEVYRCQMTQALFASTPIQVRDLGQYTAEVRSGNVGLVRFVQVAARMVWWRIVRRFGRTPDMPPLAGPDRVDGERLDLAAGDLVEVRSLPEIGRTLDANAKHRGLVYSEELTPACGKKFVVKTRVERLIDERTGLMLQMKNDCIVLEGFVCSGDRTESALFCPREAYPLFREAWLKRVEPREPDDDQLGVGTTSPTSASRATSDA
jgi:hypothetical protein